MNFEWEFITASINNTNHLSQCSATTSMIMADILSTDTVKWHKTEECIQIYNFNFLNFAFFFNKFFFIMIKI